MNEQLIQELEGRGFTPIDGNRSILSRTGTGNNQETRVVISDEITVIQLDRNVNLIWKANFQTETPFNLIVTFISQATR